jgi:cytochrome c biogenesis protein CcmG, thiol:disulfide interchange protein DsbE
MGTVALTRRRFLCSAIGTAAGLSAASAAVAGVKTGDRPASVTLTDLSGAPVRLPDAYQGKVLIVHFWATWCTSCLPEIDALVALFSEQGARGLLPVSVNIGETRTAVAEALGPRKVSYPVLLDAGSSAPRVYGVTGIPTTFVLNRSGVVEFKILGEIRREGLQRLVSRLL